MVAEWDLVQTAEERLQYEKAQEGWFRMGFPEHP